MPETADTFILRRVRPTFEGTFGGIYDFKFMPDFAGGRSDHRRRLRRGAFQSRRRASPSASSSRPSDSSACKARRDIRFIERGLPTNLVPNRDLGVQLSGDFAGGAFAYQVGYFNGVTDGQSSDNLDDARTSKSTPPATTPRACSSSRSSTPTTSTCAASASASARPG